MSGGVADEKITMVGNIQANLRGGSDQSLDHDPRALAEDDRVMVKKKWLSALSDQPSDSPPPGPDRLPETA